LLYIAGLLALSIGGAGSLSLDGYLSRRRPADRGAGRAYRQNPTGPSGHLLGQPGGLHTGGCDQEIGGGVGQG